MAGPTSTNPMPNYNSVTLVGHATRDAELKHIGEKQTALSSFGIATNKKLGEKEEAHFFDVKCWGSTAEAVAAQVRKGAGIIVVGDLQTEKWQDKATGAQRSKVVINATCVGLALYEKKGLTPQAQSRTTAAHKPNGSDSEEVPF